jgi:glycosyltransferase involved in cell wall biosynthesis
LTAKTPRIAVVSSSDERATVAALAERLRDLLARGWDARLVFDGPGAARHGASPELEGSELSRRVYLSSAHPEGRSERWRRRAAVGSVRARRPQATWRYLRADGRPPLGLPRAKQVESVLIALRPRIVHFDSVAAASGRLRAAHLTGSRAVVSLGLDDLDEPAVDAVLRDADVLHFASEPIRRRWTETGSLDSRPGVVAAWGADTGFFDPAPVRDDAAGLGTSSRPLRVVSVGALSWVHGYEWALQAIRQLLDLGIDCRYRIVGDGSYGEALGFARSELDLDGRIELVGFAGRAQLREELRWADVMLDPTVVHGPASAAPEAQAMALPVVATSRTDLTAAAPHGDHAFVVKPRDPRGLAQKLALLAGDPARRRRMGEAGRRRLLERPRAEERAAAYDRLYRVALDTRSGDPPPR